MNSTGKKIYKVQLEKDERKYLKEILDSGKGSKERRRRAHILLLPDESRPDGGLSDAGIAEVLEIGTATVERVRKRCVMEGLEAALKRKVQVNRKKRLLDGEGEAKLTMLACSEPPPGHARWSLRLLGAQLVELEIVESISRGTVRQNLKQASCLTIEGFSDGQHMNRRRLPIRIQNFRTIQKQDFCYVDKIPLIRFLGSIARPNIASVLLLVFALFSQPATTAAEPGKSHCMMGCPTHPNFFDPPINRSLYALMNDPHTKFARWVAYRVNKSNFDCPANVSRNWERDPDIDPYDTLTPMEYRDANVTLAVDLGHQAPLASFKCHSDADTINYLSNITPQFTKLNQGPWKKREVAVREIAKGGDDVWVMTGPLYEWPMAKLPSTNKMHEIPSAYWKAVSIKDNDSIKSSAFYFYQDTPKRADYCDHVKTIDFMEAKSQLDFFPAYPNQDVLERAPVTLTAELRCWSD